jgi:hypothetical protein
VSIAPEHTKETGDRSYGIASAMDGAKMDTNGVIYGEIDDESIQYRFDLMTRDDMSRYGASKSVNGKEYSEGGVNFVCQPDDFLGLCLYGIYGDGVAADGTTYATSAGYGVSGFVHTWFESVESTLPSFTLQVGREEKEHEYKGMCVNRLSISASHGEYAMMSVDFTGKSESAVDALVANPTYVGAAIDGFHFAEGTVSFSEAGASTVASSTINSINMEFNMNLDTDAACSIGDRTYRRQPQPQRREITGSVEFSTASTTSATNTPGYDMLLTTGGKLYDGGSSHPAIKLNFTNGTQSLEMQLYKVRWEAPTANVSGRDTQTLSLNFVALIDAAATNIMSKTILTHTAASSNLATGSKYSQV